MVNKERPDLEETKTQLIIQNTEFTIKLKELEDDLLHRWAAEEERSYFSTIYFIPSLPFFEVLFTPLISRFFLTLSSTLPLPFPLFSPLLPGSPPPWETSPRTSS